MTAADLRENAVVTKKPTLKLVKTAEKLSVHGKADLTYSIAAPLFDYNDDIFQPFVRRTDSFVATNNRQLGQLPTIVSLLKITWPSQ